MKILQIEYPVQLDTRLPSAGGQILLSMELQFYDDSTLSFAIRSNDTQLNKFHYTFKPHPKVGMIDKVQRKNQYYMDVG